MNLQQRLDLVHAEMDKLHRENQGEGGFLTSDARSLRLRSLYSEEEHLEDEMLHDEIRQVN